MIDTRQPFAGGYKRKWIRYILTVAHSDKFGCNNNAIIYPSTTSLERKRSDQAMILKLVLWGIVYPGNHHRQSIWTNTVRSLAGNTHLSRRPEVKCYNLGILLWSSSFTSAQRSTRTRPTTFFWTVGITKRIRPENTRGKNFLNCRRTIFRSLVLALCCCWWPCSIG